MMDYATFKAIVDEAGGPEKFLEIYCDNHRVEYSLDGAFKMEDAVDINGELVIIPVTVYNSGIQSVITLDNTDDRKRLDKHAIYTT